MKKLFIFLLILITAVCFCGCKTNDTSDESSDLSSEEVMEEPEVSNVDWEKITEEYRFLVSPYSVTATQTSAGIVYKCDYYFKNGRVTGTKSTTTFKDDESAKDYFEKVLEEDEFAFINGCSVVHFAHSKDCFYDQYTPEKLYYVLDSMGNEVVFNFDLEEFNLTFDNSSNA